MKVLATCLAVVSQPSRFNDVVNHLILSSEAHRLWSIISGWPISYARERRSAPLTADQPIRTRLTINLIIWRRLVIVDVSNCQFNWSTAINHVFITHYSGAPPRTKKGIHNKSCGTKEAIQNLSEAADPIKIDGGNHWLVDALAVNFWKHFLRYRSLVLHSLLVRIRSSDGSCFGSSCRLISAEPTMSSMPTAILSNLSSTY